MKVIEIIKLKKLLTPNKYPNKKGWNVPKQKHKVTNWSEYNAALKRRGDITVWLSDNAITQWYEEDRVYDGSGTPPLFTDFAIITCHEIRQVYRVAQSTSTAYP